MTGKVFPRTLGQDLPRAVRGEGALLWDSSGKRYIDASGGAIVVGIGHGSASVADALSEQARTVAYVHGTQFTTDALEDYADQLATLLPVEDARIYPVSGGSEAVETALKMARAHHLAKGQTERHKIIARRGSYHGNSLGALDASGRQPLRRPYEPWLGRAVHVAPSYEYRCELPTHDLNCGLQHAEWLDDTIRREGASSVACFIAEPIAGAALGAAMPTDDYWPAIAEVCREHGVLLIADEVMTGFGRTGRWFGCDHWSVRPDILVAGKGASSGYWPLGFAACSGEVFDTLSTTGFVHGFTFSHSVMGARVGTAVLDVLRSESLIEASHDNGKRLKDGLTSALADHPSVGDVRGLGLMVAIELVAEADTKEPFPRSARVTERVLSAAKERGVLLYPSTGCANGVDGDLVMMGPPFVITDGEIAEVVAVTSEVLASDVFVAS